MKERPILFSAPMVRAILDGRKTQTRRIVKPVGNDDGFVLLDHGKGFWPYRSDDGESTSHTVRVGDKLFQNETPHSCPYGQPGDRLWVREAWRITAHSVEEARAITEDIMSGTAVDWRATYADRCVKELGFSREDAAMSDRFQKWRPSIHMPRWASRILLEVTAVRVERLQDISEEDCLAEGVFKKVGVCELGDVVRKPDGGEAIYLSRGQARLTYQELWQSINGTGSWTANPWVWVVEFKRLKGGVA